MIASLLPLALASLATFDRVFTGWGWLIPAATAASASIALTHRLLTHRERLRMWTVTVGLISACVGGAAIVAVLFPSATWYLLPTREAVGMALRAAADSWDASMESVSPVDPNAGYLTLLLAAAWFSGVVSTLIGVRSPTAAALPWIGLFGYASAVGSDTRARVYTAAVIGTAIWMLYRQQSAWLSDRRSAGQRGLALRTGVAVVVGTFAVSSLVPGYGAEPLVPWASIGPSSRTELSPFVQLRPRLTQRRATPLFTVTSNQPAYWRVASMDRFDGDVWRIEGSFRSFRGEVPTSNPPETATDLVRQRFRIERLDGGWLPAAYSPERVDGVTALFDDDLDTLLVDRLRSEMAYGVTSRVPRPSFDELSRATVGGLSDAEMLQLPDLSTVVLEETFRITKDAATPYEKALAIQEHLRTFTYSTEVPAQHSADFLGHFLTELQAGYCEQFSAAMAVMLRALEIPARVAVGFLPGRLVEAANGEATYLVTTDDAHAWPEAHFDGVGWVAFEPTPRALTRVPEYTVPPAAPSDPGSAPAPTSAPDTQFPPESDPGSALPEEPEPTPAPTAPSTDIAGRATRWILAMAAATLLAILAGRLIAMRLPIALNRRGRPAIQALIDGLLLRGADAIGPKETSDTASSYGRRLGEELGLDQDSLNLLLDAHQAAAFGPEPPTEEQIRAARSAAGRLYRQIWLRAPWTGKLRMAASPSALVGPASRLGRRLSLQLAARLSPIRASSAARRV